MILRLSALTAGVALFLTLSVSGVDEGPRESPFWTTPFEGSYACVHCDPCGDSGHITWDGTIHGDQSFYPDGIHQCQGYDTCTDHGVCGGTSDADSDAAQEGEELAPTLEAIRVSVLNEDLRSLKALVELNSEVELHARRGAIQVLGCSDQVIAHFPVRPDIARMLGQ